MNTMRFRGLITGIVASAAFVSAGNMAIAQVIRQEGGTTAALAATASTNQARAELAARLALTNTFLNKGVTQKRMTLAGQGGDPAAQLVEGLSDEQVQRALATTTHAELEAVLFGSQAARDLLSTLVEKQTSVAGIQKALGNINADLVFTPLTPCRIMDTRLWSAGPLAASTDRPFDITSATAIATQGGVASGGCGVPSLARAISVNITAASPSEGFLYFWPWGASQPNASILNWKGSATFGFIANAVVGAVSPPGTAAYIRSNVNDTQVIMDVLGYFAAPFATALACTTQSAAINFAASPSTFNVFTPACPAGSTLTGGGMDSAFTSANFMFYESAPNGASWNCRGRNVDWAFTWTGACYAICCKIPGQ